VTFDPAAVRAFEHAGWQRAAEHYAATFAHATAGFVDDLLDAARVEAGRRVLDLACGPGLVAAHGEKPTASTPPPGGSVRDPADVLRLLVAAGFSQAEARPVHSTWLVSDPADLVEGFRRGLCSPPR
jgi:hypothetical protein